MKILIIRHGDPDYSIDSLTEKGWREAEMLSERIAPMNIKNYYVSPLGRAQDTISLTLKKCGRTAETFDWLQEFPVVWDMMPEEWTAVSEYYDKNLWYDIPTMRNANMRSNIERVNGEFDKLLERHGYKRKGNTYLAVSPNSDTIALFCHFGIQCVLLSHLLGIPPMVLWQGFIAAPTSVTTLATEERCNGIACFRLNSFGDTSHLYIKNEKPAFAGRFRELYTNPDIDCD